MYIVLPCSVTFLSTIFGYRVIGQCSNAACRQSRGPSHHCMYVSRTYCTLVVWRTRPSSSHVETWSHTWAVWWTWLQWHTSTRRRLANRACPEWSELCPECSIFRFSRPLPLCLSWLLESSASSVCLWLLHDIKPVFLVLIIYRHTDIVIICRFEFLV